MLLVWNYLGKVLRGNVIWEAFGQVPEMVSPVFWFDTLHVSSSVPKSAPAGFNVRLVERFGVELEWQPVDGATGYKVSQIINLFYLLSKKNFNWVCDIYWAWQSFWASSYNW